MGLHIRNEDEDLLWVHIPKTGGKSVQKWLDRNNLGAHKVPHIGIGALHDNMQKIEKLFYEQNGKKPYAYFCTARNPYSRAVSWWKYQNYLWTWREDRYPGSNKYPNLYDCSFEEWWTKRVDFKLAHIPSYHAHNLLKGQTWWIHPTRRPDFIMHTDKLNEHSKILANRIKRNQEVLFPHINASPDKSKWQSHYTEKVKDEVYKHFKEDFRYFGYHKDNFD